MNSRSHLAIINEKKVYFKNPRTNNEIENSLLSHELLIDSSGSSDKKSSEEGKSINLSSIGPKPKHIKIQ